jgi:N-acetylneuraminate synthase
MDINAMRELIAGSNIIAKARGGTKGPVKEEQPTIDFAYASVVSIKEIKAGEKLTNENIWVKRPGTGEIKAIDFDGLLGKIAQTDIPKDAQLKWVDIKK